MPITISGDAPNFTTASATTITGVTTLNASSGVLATQNGISGIANAWVQVQTSGSTPTINGAFNVSSITRVATGIYTVSFTTALPDGKYAAIASASVNQGATNGLYAQLFSQVAAPYYTAPLTTGFNLQFVADSGSTLDPVYFCVAVHR